MNAVLRRAGAADAARLALVGAATFLDGFAGVIDGDAIVAHCRTRNDEAAWRGMLAAPRSAAWIAEVDRAPVGYALMTAPDLPGANPGDLELKRIYLLSRFHGGGTAAALLATAVGHARDAGAARLMLGVYQRNDRAIAFYRRAGFESVGTRDFAVGDARYRDFVMAMPLSANSGARA